MYVFRYRFLLFVSSFVLSLVCSLCLYVFVYLSVCLVCVFIIYVCLY